MYVCVYVANPWPMALYPSLRGLPLPAILHLLFRRCRVCTQVSWLGRTVTGDISHRLALYEAAPCTAGVKASSCCQYPQYIAYHIVTRRGSWAQTARPKKPGPPIFSPRPRVPSSFVDRVNVGCALPHFTPIVAA